MLRVLMLNYEYPPLGGGAANATFHLLREMAGFGDVRLTLLTSSPGAAKTEQPYHNVTIRFLDIGKRGSLHYQTNRELLQYSWGALREAKRLLRQESFNLVHAFFGIPGGVIASRLGLPFLVSLRGSDVPGYSDRYRLADAVLFRRLSRKVWRNACAVVANSSGLRTLARKTAPSQYIEVIHNGVDTEAFVPIAKRQGRPNQPLRLLYVGRLIPRKGVDLLLKVLTRLRGVVLTIVGEGPDEPNLRRTAAESGIPVIFRGEVVHASLPDVYRAHDAFILPSRNEGMSNTVLEAMASGLPVVVTDVGGTRELVEGNGYVTEVDDVAALTHAIRSLRDGRELAGSMGQQSRHIATRYSWTAVANSYVHLYRTCANPASG